MRRKTRSSTQAQPAKPLSSFLLESLASELEESANAGETSIRAQPLPTAGAGLPYPQWIATYAPQALRYPLGDFHKRAWEWFEALTPGTAPRALIECWGRGLGKSTTIEQGCVFAGVTGRRSVVLYVCAKQDAANKHIAAISGALERLGVGRAVNAYGASKGWRMDLLRAENGFNVLAYGLDSALRGVKIENLRPDLIVLDDIDNLDDSAQTIDSNYETITQSVLPTGAEDVAVVFVQNVIHVNSIMNGIILGERDMLRYRVAAPIVPAVFGLKYEEYEEIYPDGTHSGQRLFKITEGIPAWEGKGLDKCEEEMNRFGLISFLRECQHEVGVGGLFFKEFQPTKFGKDWHLINPFPIPDWWITWTSHDYGTGAPCATLVYAANEHGDVFVIGEYYEAGKVSSEQCENHLKLLQRLGLARPEDEEQASLPTGRWKYKPRLCAFDHANTFPPQNPAQRLGEYPVEIWWRRGVPAVMSVKDRKAGWRTMKEYLAGMRYEDKEPVATFHIFRDQCPNLVRFLERAMANPRDPEDIDPGFKDDHCFVAGTQIRLVDAKTGKTYDEAIEKVAVGDLALTRKGPRKVTQTFQTPSQLVMRFTAGTHSLVGTTKHPVFTYDRGIVPLEEVTQNDRLYILCDGEYKQDEEGNPLLLKSCRIIEKPTYSLATVYNFTVEEEHEYFASGILVHNCGDSCRYGLMTRPPEALKPETNQAPTGPWWETKKRPAKQARNRDFV